MDHLDSDFSSSYSTTATTASSTVRAARLNDRLRRLMAEYQTLAEVARVAALTRDDMRDYGRDAGYDEVDNGRAIAAIVEQVNVTAAALADTADELAQVLDEETI